MGIVRKSLCGLGFGLLLLAVQLNLEPAQATVMVAGSVPDSTHSTLELWLDASTLAASTTSVSVWADQTSHGRNTVQTVAANQPRYTAINPIFKNRPTLHFDGNDILTSENVSVMNIDAAKPRSIFVVFSQDAVANQNVLGFGVISSAQMFDVLLYENKFLGHFSGWLNDTLGVTNQTYAMNQMAVSTISYDGTNIRTYQRTTSFNGILGTKPILLATGTSPFKIGGGVYNSVYPNFIGDIAEVLVYSERLSDADRTAVEAYLFSKYSNTSPIANAGADQNIYLGQTASLNGSASSDPVNAPLTYAWTLDTFPAGSTAVLVGANTVNPSLIPDKVGTYNISLKVNNGPSDSAAAKVAVIVSENLPPVAVATGNTVKSVSGTAPLLVLFDASTSSDPELSDLTYSWNFGDTTNNTSTVASPTHTYDAAGNYTAVVTVTDSFGKTDQASVPVAVLAPNLPPEILPSATPNNGAAPLAVQFTANAIDVNLGDTLVYSWDFGDSSMLSTETNPLHTYASLGTYTAKLSVSDSTNTAVTASLTISVSSSLTIHVTEAKVQPGAKGKVEGKVSMKAKFAYISMPLAKDIIRVKFDGVTLLEVPFDSFKLDSTNKYEYALKDREAEIDFKRHTIEVSRHKMLMTGIDNTNGIDVEVSFGPATGTDHADMRRDKDDDKDNKKDDHVSDYSYKRD